MLLKITVMLTPKCFGCIYLSNDHECELDIKEKTVSGFVRHCQAIDMEHIDYKNIEEVEVLND